MAATVASADFYSEDAASPQTATKPVGTASGDLLVYVIAQGDSTLANLTAPAGWATTSSASGGSVTGKAFTKVAGGSEPGTYDFPYSSGADVAAVMIRVTGADTTPTIVQAVGVAGPNGGACDSPTVTPTGVDDLLIVAMSAACGGVTLVETDPSGTTDLGQGQVAGGFQALAAAYQQLVSSSATGAKTWSSITPATKPGVSFSIAIKSAGGGGGAPAFVQVQGGRRRMPARPARVRVSTPVRSQVNPPYPTAFDAQPRRLRGIRPRRAGFATPVPAQIAPAPVYPPQPERLRLKVVRLFRPRVVAPVPAQVIFTAPSYPPQPERIRLKVARIFRGRVAAPVPPQVVFIQPAYPPQPERARLRGLRQVRPRLTGPVPAQAAVAPPVFVPQPDPRPRLRLRPVRGHAGVPPPVPVLVPLFVRAKRRVARLFRGEVSTPVPAQVVLIAPGRVPQATNARRLRFGMRRHRGGVEGWMVGGSHLCVITRPSTGTTAHPVMPTTRPFTGITEEPC